MIVLFWTVVHNIMLSPGLQIEVVDAPIVGSNTFTVIVSTIVSDPATFCTQYFEVVDGETFIVLEVSPVDQSVEVKTLPTEKLYN